MMKQFGDCFRAEIQTLINTDSIKLDTLSTGSYVQDFR